MKNKRLSGSKATTILLAVFCCVLWGSITPVVKVSYAYFSLSAQDTPGLMIFAGIRYILCGLAGIAFGTFRTGKPLVPAKASWGRICKLAMVQTFIQQLSFYISMTRVSGINGSILGSLNNFFSILIACLIFRQEKLTARKLLGCCLGFAGVVVINLTQGGFGSRITLMGEGMMLIACISCGASYVMIKEYTPHVNVLVLNSYQFLVGGAALFLAGTCLGGQIHTSNLEGYLLFAYMVVMPITAFTIWGELLRSSQVSQLSVFGFINPITGVLLSSVFLAEHSTISPWRCGLSLLLVSLGIYTVNSISPKEKPAGNDLSEI